MQIIIFTASMMWKQAAKLESRLWLCGLVLGALFVVTPQEQISYQLVSCAVLLPSVFLLTGWRDSSARNGIVAIITRGNSRKRVQATEWLLPALSGAVISSLSVFAVATPPLWQFWIVALLTSISFSMILLLTEKYLKYPGRTILTLIWLAQLAKSQEPHELMNILLFTGYPAMVLFSDSGVTHHPDTYVLASLTTMLITTSIYTLLLKKEEN